MDKTLAKLKRDWKLISNILFGWDSALWDILFLFEMLLMVVFTVICFLILFIPATILGGILYLPTLGHSRRIFKWLDDVFYLFHRPYRPHELRQDFRLTLPDGREYSNWEDFDKEHNLIQRIFVRIWC